MKRMIAILIAVCILLPCMPTIVIAQGTTDEVSLEQNVTAPVEETTAPVEETTAPVEEPTTPAVITETMESMEEAKLLAEGDSDVHTDHHVCSCAITGGTSCSHEENTVWLPWDGKSNITTGGNYYLTQDVTLSGTASFGFWGIDVNLCLNGHTIEADSTHAKYLLQVGASEKATNMTIMDCATQYNASTGELIYKGGIKNSTSSVGNGGGIQVGYYKNASTQTASALKLIGVELSGNTESNKGERYGGGALNVRNGDVTIEYSKFSNNKATGAAGSGGAITVFAGSVTAKHTEFSNNQAVLNGGAIYLSAGSGTLNLTNCSFTGNTAGQSGSAIYVGSYSGVIATGTTFSQNKAPENGKVNGAVYAAEGAAKLEFTNGSFSGNEAYDGSAIFVAKGCALTVNGTAFSDNEATHYGSVYVENGAGALSFTNGSFTGNRASYGSAIFLNGNNTLNVNGTSFSGNTVTKNGTLYTAGATVNLTDITMSGNTGGLYAGSASAKITLSGNTRIFNNTENVSLAKDNTKLYIGKLGENARIYVSTATTDTDVAFLTTGAGFDAAAWTADSEKLLYENAGAYVSYGEEKFYLVYHTHYDCSCVITGDTSCDHTENAPVWKAWTDGSSLPKDTEGYYFLTTDVVLSERQTMVANINLCLNGHSITAAESLTNSMIRVDDGKHAPNVTIMDCQTVYDTATGACTYSGTVTGGHSNGGGGAIQLGHQANTEASSLKLIGVALTGNIESYGNKDFGGGAVHVRNGNADIQYCKFADNRADGKVETLNEETGETEATYVGSGGAISICQGYVTAKNTEFTDNKASSNGGAIYLRNVAVGLELTDCVFTGNEAVYGSAVFTQANNTVNIADSEFTKNTASKNGTIFVVNGTTALTDVTIQDNQGGLYINNISAKVTISGNIQIHGNAGTENVHLDKDGVMLYVGQLDKAAKVHITTKTEGITDPDVFLAVAENVTLANTKNTGIYQSGLRGIGYEAGETSFYFTDTHNHCLCGDGADAACDHKDNSWSPWYKTDSLPTEKGNYYLVSDVTMAQTALIMTADITIQLCLNGKTVTAPAEGAVYSVFGQGVKLTVTDCTAKTVDGVYTSGKITGATASAIMMRENSVLSLFEGSISGNPTTSGGGAVSLVKATGTFNMYGGEIADNTAKSGGGVYIAVGSTMNLRGGTIRNNEATEKFGGGIRNLGTLNMTGGSIEDNTAAGRGGGVYQEGADSVGVYQGGYIQNNSTSDDTGGGLFITAGTAKLSGTVIRGNEVPELANGAGVVAAGKATVTMSDGEISGHTAKNGAGVVVMGGSRWTITGGSIKNNQAVCDSSGKGGEGGGIYVAKNSFLTVSGGSISGNTAQTNAGGIVVYNNSAFNMTGGRIENNTAEANAGGLYLIETEANLKGGYILTNRANTGNGGGISTSLKCKVTLDGTFISENYAEKNAGGILMAGAGSELTFLSGTIRMNESGKSGGGIYISIDAHMDMQGGIVKFNTSKDGGGIFVLAGSANLSGGTINNNTATNNGGGMIVSDSSSATIAGEVKFVDNEAVLGAAVGVVKASFLTMEGGILEKNDASKYGGAVAVLNQSKLTFTDGEMTQNTAQSGGAIILNTGSQLLMDGDAVIADNRATNGYGGGIAAASVSDPRVSITVKGGTISDNMAKSTGGAINLNGSKLNMSGGSISGNIAGTAGGGIYLIKSTATLSGGRISSNVSYKNGGGVSTGANTTLNLCGATISGNSSIDEEGCGGGILVLGKGSVLNFSSGTISGNKVPKSGAGLYMAKNTTLNMSGGTVSENEAGVSGGGMILGLCTTNITGGAVTKNISKGTGGGISNSGKCELNISGVTISENYAEKAGGGLVVVTRDTVLNLSDSVIENNISATNNGGGLYQSRYVTINVTNTEFNGNKAELKGGGLYLAGKVAYLSGVTIDGNEAVGHGGGLLLETWTKMYAEGLEVHNNISAKHGGGMYLTNGTRTELSSANFTGNQAGERGGAIWAGADLAMRDVKAIGNTSGKLGTVYLADSKYDGESYVAAVYSMAGDMYIYDNPGEGKDLYLSGVSCLSVQVPGLGKDTKIGINLKEGLLTDKVYGEYDYEGGNLEYIITYGDRSVTEPELLPAEEAPEDTSGEATEPTEPAQQPSTKKIPVVPLVVAVAALVIVILLLLLLGRRRKKND